MDHLLQEMKGWMQESEEDNEPWTWEKKKLKINIVIIW